MRIKPLSQLGGVLFATMVILLPLRSTSAAPAKVDSVTGELEAAKLAESRVANDPAATAEQWNKVDEIYRSLRRKYPENARVMNTYAAFLWQQGQMDRAESLWREAAKLDPNGPETLAGLGTAALAGGDVRKAASCYRRACESAPENPRLHFDLANVLYLFRRDLLDSALPDTDAVIAQAMKHYAEACRLAPRNVDFARGYAETFYGLPKPDWEGALVAWQHLLEISPQQDFALANLATVHLRLGNKEAARAYVGRMASPEFATRKALIKERIERE